ncbi:MAG: PASTA domain-containing protein [Acidobacteriota bacterium]
MPTGTDRSLYKRGLAVLGWLAALALLAVAFFAGSLYIAVRTVFTGRELTVPDVVELSLDEARAKLNESDLYLEVTSRRYDEHVAAGVVRAQAPPPGAAIKPNRKVRVSVSLGPVKVEVPDVRGQTLRTARLQLQRQGLPVGHVTFTHERDVAPDLVIAQEPPPSTDGQAGDAGSARSARPGWDGHLDLLVSRGPEEPVFVMPDLIDRPVSQVREFADRAGLRLGAVRTKRILAMPRGRVVRQYPQAGYPIGKHDIISLVLSE